ncbi:UDP-glycosyltransferase 71B5 [Abeliophyllum distichum]|uniref:Glycosyltransferase n=1 Tax=Abeliophyllum distichum TaxID=126358 RepID=A0ABD1SI67_9LAMI
MASTTNLDQTTPHIAIFPTAGMGHLMPFLRLAAMLATRNCTVTVIAAKPTVSAAESDQLSSFFATHQNIKCLEFQLLPYNPTTDIDPFFAQFIAISNSVHLLHPLLSNTSPPLSTFIADFTIASSVCKIATDLSIPTYVLITTSARFFSLLACHSQLVENNAKKGGGEGVDYIEIPAGLPPVPLSSIPPPFFNPNHYFSAIISANAPSFTKVNGILVNTFDWFESATIEVLNSGRVVRDLAPILPVGPLESFKFGHAPNLPWLDNQPAKSVLFISFGSRTALSKDQLSELGVGLEKSGCKFLWILKGSKVDKQDKEEIEEILDESFLERTKNRGMVMKGWVNQEQILAHPAIGGFLSHCGWNSVMEAARQGVPILAWPQHGDQRVNAQVVENAGLGSWARDWIGEKILVKGEEIEEKIREIMRLENLAKASEVREKARHAREIGGNSEQAIQGIIEASKQNERS